MTEDYALTELTRELQERIANYQRLIEVCRRSIAISQQDIVDYEAKVAALRASLGRVEAVKTI